MSLSVGAIARLIRPKQWAKNGFVLLGPLYGFRDHIAQGMDPAVIFKGWAGSVVLTIILFSLVSSSCYVVNDILDASRDRFHPRKRKRPIASGEITPRQGWIIAALLLGASFACIFLLPGAVRTPVAVLAGVYAANVWAYSLAMKHVAVLDVLSLSMGFVLRVVAGCACVAISPSTWLLNVTLFLAMFLAFGKRLGERRTLGDDATNARGVQGIYTDDILRMFVVVTAVGTLITYAFYIQSREGKYLIPMSWFPDGLNLLWLTILPATYALARAILLIERGKYDDPTEMASKDPPTQLAAILFAAATIGVVVWGKSV